MSAKREHSVTLQGGDGVQKLETRSVGHGDHLPPTKQGDSWGETEASEEATDRAVPPGHRGDRREQHREGGLLPQRRGGHEAIHS